MDKFGEYRRLMAMALESADCANGIAQRLAFLEIARLWRQLAERGAECDVPHCADKEGPSAE